jgi:hypothetical protein
VLLNKLRSLLSGLNHNFRRRMEKVAHFLYSGDEVLVKSSYNPEFVFELKKGLKSRRWNREKKSWIINIKEPKDNLK